MSNETKRKKSEQKEAKKVYVNDVNPLWTITKSQKD